MICFLSLITNRLSLRFICVCLQYSVCYMYTVSPVEKPTANHRAFQKQEVHDERSFLSDFICL